MSKEMKVCVVCKTPIQNCLEIETSRGYVHPGPCSQVLSERSETINESDELQDVQMIL